MVVLVGTSSLSFCHGIPFFDNAQVQAQVHTDTNSCSISGSLDVAPTPRTSPCEFDSCPADSPAVGADPKNPRLEYVNSYPVTSIKNGINSLAPRFFNGSKPDLAVTGFNVGANLGLTTQISGTVGAAVQAIKEGVPAIAFSGTTGTQISYTDKTPLYAQIYADLSTNITMALIDSGKPYLPNDVWLNVNFPAVSDDTCNKVSDFKFVLSRINVAFLSPDDVETCGTNRLPTERSVVTNTQGCYVSISPGDEHKLTADVDSQAVVLKKLGHMLSCLP